MLRKTVPLLFSIIFVHGISYSAQTKPASAASASASAPSANHEVAELINESGRLRMMSERMGKAYAQILLGVMPDKAQKQIKDSQKRFDEILILTRKGASTADIKERIDAVSNLYQQYNKALAKPADKAALIAAHKITDELVAEADKLTQAFQAQSPIATAKIINLSGRQRMLSQRMARQFFAATALGTKADLDKSHADFTTAMATLETAQPTSKAIKDELQQAKVQWLFLDQALTSKSDMNTNIKDVATTSERLLEIMDNLTNLYSQALAKTAGS